MESDIVGEIRFGRWAIPVYNDLNEPLFLAQDIMSVINYSPSNSYKFMQMVEEDEKLKLPLVVSGQKRHMWFITETGLYNTLYQSSMPLAHAWRRIISNQLISMRKSKGFNIIEQFDEWNHLLDDIYYNEETGLMYQSITVPGGDVEQVVLV